MKTTIKYACGHTSVVQLYGSSRERESKERWLSQQVCMECKRRGQQLEVQAVTKAYNLPELEGGTEKQRSWALSIRAEWLKRMCDGASRYGDKADAVRAALVEAAATQRSAVWWIDNRSNLNAALAPAYEEALKRRGITE
jgi:predicted secreted protein